LLPACAGTGFAGMTGGTGSLLEPVPEKLVPAEAGSRNLGMKRFLFRYFWIPASAGMTGGIGSPPARGQDWVPASAGMTGGELGLSLRRDTLGPRLRGDRKMGTVQK